VYRSLQTQGRFTMCPQGQPGSSGLPPVSAPPSHGAAIRHHSGGSDRLRCALVSGSDLGPVCISHFVSGLSGCHTGRGSESKHGAFMLRLAVATLCLASGPGSVQV